MKFHGNSDATKAPLRLIYFAGLHPDNASKLADLYFGINNFVWLFIAVLALVAMVRSENLETALEPWQSFLTMIQCVLEGLPARYHKGVLKQIIADSKSFWKIEHVPRRVEKECSELLAFAGSFCKTWIYFVSLLTLSYNLAPTFLGGLPYPCYVPGDHRLLVYVLQMWATATMVIAIVGISVIFVSICAETVVQYRLLENEFEQICSESKVCNTLECARTGRNYRELVDHHNFLLKYCEQLRKYGNEVFVFKVVMTAATLCAHLYITLQGNFSWLNKIKCGLFFGGQIFDFACYCVAAEVVSSASVSAGNAIYSCNWLKCVPEMRTTVIMVLVRAQKQFNFVGQGLVVMNLRTLTQVFKTALSFQAYLRTMSSKGNNQ